MPATSEEVSIAAAATAGQNDVATPVKQRSEAQNMCAIVTKCRTSEKKHDRWLHEDDLGFSIFCNRPGSQRLASGPIRQKVLNFVSLLPSFVTKHGYREASRSNGRCSSRVVRGWPGEAI